MKTINKIILAATTSAVLAIANQATAQLPSGVNDGIIASPRLRSTMNDYKTVASTDKPLAAAPAACCEKTIVASPRLTQFFSEQQITAVGGTADATIATPTSNPHGGIVASPRLQQFFAEHNGAK